MMKKAKQHGDTLIEVLLAMTVIGLVLSASFGIANRAAQTGRAAQERTEALKLAESQLELIKAYIKDTSGGDNVESHSFSSFCIDMTAPAAGAEAVNSTSSECRNIDVDGNSGGFYNVEIVNNADTYEITVQWDRINTEATEPGTLTLFYRTGVL